VEPVENLPVVNSPEIAKRDSKAGRKPWIPQDLGQVETLASTGLTYTQIADALGIHVHTLLRKRSQFEAFAEALKRGRAKGISAVANKLWQLAVGGNVVACIFFLNAKRVGARSNRSTSASLMLNSRRKQGTSSCGYCAR
jgi:hypothetical protein